MANRNFNRFQALEKEVKAIYASVTIGASGAPTLDAVNSKGVASITRTSAGLYVLTLQDKYTRLMDFHCAVKAAAAESLAGQLASETVATNKTVTFRTQAAGVATDPVSGDVLLIRLHLKNSSVR